MNNSIINNDSNMNFASSSNDIVSSGVYDSNNLPTLSTSTTNNSDVSFLSRISWGMWGLIFFILMFLGINIFVYLGKGTELMGSFIEPVLQKIFGITIGTSAQIIDVSAEGAKKVLEKTDEVLESGLIETQQVANHIKRQELSHANVEKTLNNERITQDNVSNSALNKALNTSKAMEYENNTNSDYEANESETKSGWCFIGKDNGVRTCKSVTENDKCMSGDIFPSQEICVNPRLRA